MRLKFLVRFNFLALTPILDPTNFRLDPLSSQNIIPTPWNHRLRRFRQMALPFVGFAATLLLTAWFWQHEQSSPNAIREVKTLRMDAARDGDGNDAPLAPDRDHQIGLGGHGKTMPIHPVTTSKRS